jgi:hypothetical protein
LEEAETLDDSIAYIWENSDWVDIFHNLPVFVHMLCIFQAPLGQNVMCDGHITYLALEGLYLIILWDFSHVLPEN